MEVERSMNAFVKKSGDTMTGQLSVTGSSDQIQLKVKANATQTSNLTEWQSSAGAALSVVDGTGRVGIGTGVPTHALTLATGKDVSAYNTADQTTNYERVRQYWSSDAYYINSAAGGSGTIRNISIGNATNNIAVRYLGSEKIYVTTSSGAADITGMSFVHTSSNSSGDMAAIKIAPVVNQSGTASYTALRLNVTETATGSGAKNLLDLQVGSSSKFKIDNTGKITSALAQAYTPSNVTTSRTFDADTVDVGGLADVVGTLLADLKALGVTN